MNFLTEIVAFVVAIGVLVVVHEFGHYSVARMCGVKVLRFSVGFGKPLVQWISKKTGVEWTIAALPLGGYVKMLDEREVDPESGRRFPPKTCRALLTARASQAHRDRGGGAGRQLPARDRAVFRRVRGRRDRAGRDRVAAAPEHRGRARGFRRRRNRSFDARRAAAATRIRSVPGPICAGSCSTRRSIIVASC